MQFIITLIAALIVGLYMYKKKVTINAKSVFLAVGLVLFVLILSDFCLSFSDFCKGFAEGLQDSRNSR
ncbi:hypothetical protein [Mammaliicoccus sciuri]|uniref:hypothetical protein n=1 Tax=Mammaliicoccus sciuri TaxID=1296 RepID=UPI000D1ECE18|nr:hypothetical protein [Mammaliicoccus sciuri]PTK10728.1 hypothetical protein BU001_02775 [Mammaliicoccus sciuri]